MRTYSRRFLLCLILLCMLIPYSAQASLRVSFFDAGAGRAALLQADGQTMLIDAGAAADKDAILDCLAGFDISMIDLVASSFLREDGTAGIGAVLDKYETGTLWLPGTQAGGQPVDQALADMQSSRTRTVTPTPGKQMDVGMAKVTVLNLANQADGTAPYLALRVEYGEHSFLFLPGVDALGEGLMPESGTELHADVLSVDGEDALSPIFLNAISPLWAVVGKEAAEDAHTQWKDAGILVLQPVKGGIITFISDGKALYAEHESDGVVLQSSVNMRKEASAKAGKAATLSKGTVVGILGTAQGKEGLWYHIEVSGKAGFVRGDLIEEVSKEEAERLLTQATPKPKRTNNNRNNDSGEDTQGGATADCH